MRKHQHEEERRTKKLKKLIGHLDTAILSADLSRKDIDSVLKRTAETLNQCQVYQDWKSRN